MQINVQGVTLTLPGALVLEARAAIRACPDSAEEVGLCVLLMGLPKLAAHGQTLYLQHGGLTRSMAGAVLDVVGGGLLPLAMEVATALVSASVPAPVKEAPPAAPPLHWSNIPDPYPGLVLDTGKGPEGWLDFAARTNNGRAEGAEQARERWLAVVSEWEGKRPGGG